MSAVNFGEWVPSIRPSDRMIDQAAKAGVPHSDTEFDAIAVALYWAQVGKVFPLIPPHATGPDGKPLKSAGKIPAQPGNQWQQGTRDADTIRRWWTERPECGVGITTQASGLLVVDLDPRNRGEIEFVELAEKIGLDLTEVPFSTSPSYDQGKHLFWRLPDGYPHMALPFQICRGADVPWLVPVAGSWKHATISHNRQGKPNKAFRPQIWTAGDPLDLPAAPVCLLEALKRRGGLKGVPAAEDAGTGRTGLSLTKLGELHVEKYEAEGIPIGEQDNTLIRIATKMAGQMAIAEDEAIDRCYRMMAKSPEGDSADPWTYDRVAYKVHKAYGWTKNDIAIKRARLDDAAALLSNFLKGNN